jgi:hemoglobin/transferrin/lactoferrin receptor protein
MTHNISIYYNINYLIKTNLSIENISDLHYRTYSSGISAPGRNINFGINIKF